VTRPLKTGAEIENWIVTEFAKHPPCGDFRPEFEIVPLGAMKPGEPTWDLGTVANAEEFSRRGLDFIRSFRAIVDRGKRMFDLAR
jgi:hypothetical protein